MPDLCRELKAVAQRTFAIWSSVFLDMSCGVVGLTVGFCGVNWLCAGGGAVELTGCAQRGVVELTGCVRGGAVELVGCAQVVFKGWW